MRAKPHLLELEEAKCLHGRVPQGGLKKAAEVFFRHAGALGNLAELQGVMRIRFENRPHEIQRRVDLLGQAVGHAQPLLAGRFQ